MIGRGVLSPRSSRIAAEAAAAAASWRRARVCAPIEKCVRRQNTRTRRVLEIVTPPPPRHWRVWKSPMYIIYVLDARLRNIRDSIHE